MATHRIPILNYATVPDASGSVWTISYDEVATNDVWKLLVTAFADTATRIGLRGGFMVPKNYVSGAAFKVVWNTTATSGNAKWDVDYRAVATDGTESADQAGTQQAVTTTTAASGTASRLTTTTITPTAGNFVADDFVEFELFRDGAGADTIAATLVLFGLYFEYADV